LTDNEYGVLLKGSCPHSEEALVKRGGNPLSIFENYIIVEYYRREKCNQHKGNSSEKSGHKREKTLFGLGE